MYQAAIKALDLIPPISTSSTQTGADVDLKGYLNPGGREMTIVADVGVVQTAGNLAVKIQNAAATSAYSDLDTTSFPTTTATTGIVQWRVKTTQRYLRAVATVTTGTYVFSVQALVDVEIF